MVPPIIDGVRAYGVPVGGAFDPIAAECAQLFCGSSDGTTVLEVVSPMTLSAQSDVLIGLADAGEPVSVDGRKLSGPGRLVLRAGSQLEVSAPRKAYRRYLCWQGLRCHSKIPVSLVATDTLSAVAISSRIRSFKLAEEVVPVEERVIHVVTDEPISREEFVVSPQLSRAGLRLTGPIDGRSALGLSEPSVLGAVQVTPGGEILIHGPDGPTIGGYPKIGVVAYADIRVLAHLRPGDSVRLVPVSIPHALELNRHLQERMQILRRAISLAQSASDEF